MKQFRFSINIVNIVKSMLQPMLKCITLQQQISTNNNLTFYYNGLRN